MEERDEDEECFSPRTNIMVTGNKQKEPAVCGPESLSTYLAVFHSEARCAGSISWCSSADFILIYDMCC